MTSIRSSWREYQGSALAVVSAACMASTFIFSKLGLQGSSQMVFGLVWYAAAFACAWAYNRARGLPPFGHQLRRFGLRIVLVAAFNCISILAFYEQIRLADPSTVGFLSVWGAIVTLAIGMLILGERLGSREWLGVVLAMGGIFALTWQGGPTIWLVILLALADTTSFSISNVIAKSAVADVHPASLVGLRALFTGFFVGLYGVAMGDWQVPSGLSLLYAAAGGFFGPFLSVTLLYYAYRRLPISRASVITAAQPLFVVLYSWLFLSTIPSWQEWLGGLLTIAGLLILLNRDTAIRAVAVPETSS
ncbi:MAG: DMT family transporter [Anaerolineae bacterium]|nr:DMT family transporter [Anaerolineae bacterium]